MTNFIKIKKTLPLLLTRKLRCPSLSYIGQKNPQTLGNKGFEGQLFYSTAALGQSKFKPCQARGKWQGQTLLMPCSFQYVPSKIQSQTFFSVFRRKRKTAQQFQEADKVDSHYELIYNVHDGVRYVQLGMGMLNILSAAINANVCMFALGVPPSYFEIVLAFPVESGIFISINSLICFALLKVIKWYPLRIYYSDLEDKYLAIFMGVHPFAIRSLKIQPGEVKLSPPNKIAENVLPWASDIYAISSQRIFLFIHHFRYPSYYNKLLGYIQESSVK